MKKLNIPLVVFLLIGTVVTVVGVHFLHSYQLSRSADRLLARAEKAAADGDVDEQMRLLGRYMRHRPDDLTNLKLLLEVSRKHLFTSEDANFRDMGMLLQSLEKAIRDHPEDADLRRQGYIFSAGIGRYSDALDHLTQLKSMGEITPEDRIVLARCYWLNGNSRESMNELCELTGFDVSTKTFDDQKAAAPSQVNAYALLALVYIRDVSKDTDLTVPTMILDKAVERNPESVDAYLRRASFFQENFDGPEGKEKSLADIKKALELAPDDAIVILAAASTAMALGDFSWAATLIDEGLVKHPDNPDMFAKRAEIARAQNQTEQALTFINQGLEKNQMNRELLYRRGSYQIERQLNVWANNLTRCASTSCAHAF
jgi:tetratricopeptide (TPR) repeat protein